tara:strand:- start:1582 stop:1776 length:195 start_codon:yes stop_codon:yes gene_type:complete
MRMLFILLLLNGCSEVLLVGSIGGTVVSQSPVVKAYNGVDALTIIRTDKDLKQHVYEGIKNEKK